MPELGKKNTLEKIVHNTLVSDASALTLLNTPIASAIELGCGMSMEDSALTRAVVSVTNPLFGIVRDAGKKIFNINPKVNKKKSILFDVGLGVGTAVVEFGAAVGKYTLTKYIRGEPLEGTDLKAAAITGVYTAVLGGDLMGMAIDTFRDGLGLEKKEDGRSLFPKEMDSKTKRNIVYGLTTATWAGLSAYYLYAG